VLRDNRGMAATFRRKEKKAPAAQGSDNGETNLKDPAEIVLRDGFDYCGTAFFKPVGQRPA
jgi:hypothetical protein